MIRREEIGSPALLAYDRPSPKLLSFLSKHFGLKEYFPQANKFVVYDQYFEEAPTKKGIQSAHNETCPAMKIRPTDELLGHPFPGTHENSDIAKSGTRMDLVPEFRAPQQLSPQLELNTDSIQARTTPQLDRTRGHRYHSFRNCDNQRRPARYEGQLIKELYERKPRPF